MGMSRGLGYLGYLGEVDGDLYWSKGFIWSKWGTRGTLGREMGYRDL